MDGFTAGGDWIRETAPKIPDRPADTTSVWAGLGQSFFREFRAAAKIFSGSNRTR